MGDDTDRIGGNDDGDDEAAPCVPQHVGNKKYWRTMSCISQKSSFCNRTLYTHTVNAFSFFYNCCTHTETRPGVATGLGWLF